MKNVLVIVSFLWLFVSPAQAAIDSVCKEIGPDRLSVGFGIGPLIGVEIGYEQHLSEVDYILYQVDMKFSAESLQYMNSRDIMHSYQAMSVGYRKYLSEDSGWYLGAGVGVLMNVIYYSPSDYFTYGTASLGYVEFGWKKQVGSAAFLVGIRPVAVLSQNGALDNTKLPVAKQSAVKNVWEQGFQPSGLSIGIAVLF